MHSNFVHLHTHSYYSLLDGALPVDVICNKAKEYKMPSVALTDHGNLFGAVEFYQKAMASGVKPIIGCEVYILNKGDRREKVPYRDGQGLCHLTLLVKNHKGYQNLSKLITSGYLEGFYYKPRIDKEILEQHCEGLIALSACFKGEVPGLFKKGLDNEARKAAEYYSSLFGQSRFYLEIMRHGLEGQDEVNDKLLSLSKELGIPVVATNDSHYRSKDDAEAQDALICIQTGKLLEDTDRLKMEGSEFYFKSPEAMKLLFEDIPEAIDNTVEIAQRCNFEFDFKTYHFPHFTAPEGKDLATYLEESTIEGLNKRWSLIQSHNKNKNENELKEFYMSRIKRELDLIKSMGFAGYFLIVADFIGYAKKSDIPVGPGRGSAAGSLVAYCLGITNIDPMPYHLLFERFLNPERISMPDMDIDFCMRQRDKVIQYVSEKYGNVSQIITFGKMKARAVVRDVGRVLNMSYSDVDRIAKLIPNTLGITLDVALKVEPQLKDAQKKDPCVERLLAIARKLEGFPRHASTHAAGVVMADQPLVNFLPLYKGQNDEIVTQFDMKNVEKIGLIKFDFLGLKTLTVIDDALKIVKRTRNQDLNIEDIPMDDENVYKQLSLGNTAGVFQLESSGMTDLVMRLKPNLFEDIVALVALFRPGPLGSGMVDDFIARKHGQVAIEYIIPELEEILKDTYGVIVYQEQVMQIASKLANYTLGDADILRRAMGKKNIDEMDEQKEKFLAGSKKNKLPPVK
ncbi:DNA polymerase III subunit alpha, partial [bacterium]|nr:DNA polymerase III subunit alpha [bacterium]